MNARDLGGMTSEDGMTVRRSCLIRSANLSRATLSDIDSLVHEYHLRLVIDLRTPMAAGMKPDVVIEGVSYYPLPVFDDAMIGVTHESDRDYPHRKKKMPDMRDLYRMMVLRQECRERFGRVLRMIMEHDYETGSILWHCSEGKDRCGLISAFLLSALRVDRQQIISDYLITNETAVTKAEEYYHLVLENGGSQEVAESVRDAFVVKEAYLLSAFDAIEEEYADMQHYLEEGLGIPENILDTFRNTLLE